MKEYKYLSWAWGADRKIVRGSLFGITRLCWVMPNSDSEGPIFLSAPSNHDRFFFLHTFWSPAFDFNVEVTINEFAILKVDVVWDVAMASNPSILTIATWPPVQPMYWQHVLLFVFYLSYAGRIRVCKIRFVSTGENSKKPCLVCKKTHSNILSIMYKAF